MRNATETADMILTAADQVTGVGVWEGFACRKVFIVAVYEHLEMEARGVSFVEFGAMLVELMQLGLIKLSRADLVEAMDRDMVVRSEVAYLNATFNFVRIDA